MSIYIIYYIICIYIYYIYIILYVYIYIYINKDKFYCNIYGYKNCRQGAKK